MILPDDRIVIVGAGCFGLSTAYHLLQRGYTKVTVIDRSLTIPADDAASNDLNKVVRTSYSDVFYTELAADAIRAWKDTEIWGDTYHESGVLVLGALADLRESAYANAAYFNDRALGAGIRTLDNGDAIRAVFPSHIDTGSFSRSAGYLNRDGGWANAAKGVALLLSHVIALGGSVVSGKGVDSLLRDGGGKTAGVQCVDGTTIHADLVILATGAWTASAFPELGLSHTCLATGQSVAVIQLSAEEAARYKHCPVVLDFSSGFYIFPPNDENLVKLAVHGAGHTHTNAQSGISSPRTVSSHAEEGLRIPKTVVTELRSRLREVYPDLAEKPFIKTRLCWYTDSPDGDFVIGYHPKDTSLMLATAGSGHAYKFLPVIGRLVADAVQGTLEPSLRLKFSIDRVHMLADQSRSGQTVKELDLECLCSPEDLLPQTK